MDFPYGETVTRLRAATVPDPYSSEDTQLDWSTPASLAIPGCAFNPGVSSEPVEVGRTSVITRPEVYAPFGSDILAGDRLVVRGVTFEVAGTPGSWHSPFTGWEPGMTVQLEAVEG